MFCVELLRSAFVVRVVDSMSVVLFLFVLIAVLNELVDIDLDIVYCCIWSYGWLHVIIELYGSELNTNEIALMFSSYP